MNNGELTNPGRQSWIPKDCRPRDARRDLFKQFRPLSAQAVFEHHKASYVAAGPRQTPDKAGSNRIDHDCKYNRHRTRRLEQRRYGRVANRQDDIRPRNQFRRIFPAVAVNPRPATNVKLYVTALNPT